MSTTPKYDWMVSYSDLDDALIKKRGDLYLQQNPNPDNNFYDQTAAKFINFVNSFNIDVAVLNAQVNDPTNSLTNRTHYLVRQWLITCLQMLVCKANYGINNVDNGVQDDVYFFRYKEYSKDLISIQGGLKYETIVSGALQQNFTRAGSGGFAIKW